MFGVAQRKGKGRGAGCFGGASLLTAMLGVCLSMAGLLALINLIFFLVLIMHYFGWRGYDKEFDTEYRFRQGRREGFDGWPWLIPLWLVKLLRMIEARGWL